MLEFWSCEIHSVDKVLAHVKSACQQGGVVIILDLRQASAVWRGVIVIRHNLKTCLLIISLLFGWTEQAHTTKHYYDYVYKTQCICCFLWRQADIEAHNKWIISLLFDG